MIGCGRMRVKTQGRPSVYLIQHACTGRRMRSLWEGVQSTSAIPFRRTRKLPHAIAIMQLRLLQSMVGFQVANPETATTCKDMEHRI